MAIFGTCAIEGCCSSSVITRGWCEKHYTRWKRHGDPVFTMKRRRISTDAAPPEKKCTRCGEIKLLSEFAKDSRSGDGVRHRCKACTNAIEKETRDPEKDRARSRVYRAKNPEKTRARVRRWRSDNADRFAETSKMWRDSRPEAMKAQAARYYNKVKRNPTYRITAAIKTRIHAILTKKDKGGRRTFDILGYTADDLKSHLERQFLPGMSWDNYGMFGWHVDHIVPLSAHNYATTEDADFLRAWSLNNLRPLWANENWSKGAKLPQPFQPSFAFGGIRAVG